MFKATQWKGNRRRLEGGGEGGGKKGGGWEPEWKMLERLNGSEVVGCGGKHNGEMMKPLKPKIEKRFEKEINKNLNIITTKT